jgi:protein involved in polysaccharide export with SLBB domain
MDVSLRTIFGAGLLTAMLGSPLVAQQIPVTPDPTGLYVTRAELTSLLSELERTAREGRGAQAEHARRTIPIVQARLSEGDFRVGDRVALVVEGEPALTDTFSVRTGQTLVLPEIGTISLHGVLRAELEDYLRREFRRYIRDPVVYARPLISISVSGHVDQPGFYELPAEARLNDVLMAAGGPAREAHIEGIRIERDGQKILHGEALRQAVIEGRTLDQLNLRAGDRVIVPREGIFNLGPTAQWLLLTVPGLILGAFRVF